MYSGANSPRAFENHWLSDIQVMNNPILRFPSTQRYSAAEMAAEVPCLAREVTGEFKENINFLPFGNLFPVQA